MKKYDMAKIDKKVLQQLALTTFEAFQELICNIRYSSCNPYTLHVTLN